MNKHIPTLMLSLPNSGSTWFAETLSQHLPGCNYYDMEFFNPIRNEKHERTLSKNFGCELQSCFANIATEGDKEIDQDILNTWGSEDYTFTKEVFSPFKLPVFARHFKCFVLLRSASESFPPRRLRIWSFYEHAWWAMKAQGFKLVAETVRDRAYEAHQIMVSKIIEDANELGIEIIDYSDLFKCGNALETKLERALGYVDKGMLTAISKTRKVIPRGSSA